MSFYFLVNNLRGLTANKPMRRKALRFSAPPVLAKEAEPQGITFGSSTLTASEFCRYIASYSKGALLN
jgi:hypothetical protein